MRGLRAQWSQEHPINIDGGSESGGYAVRQELRPGAGGYIPHRSKSTSDHLFNPTLLRGAPCEMPGTVPGGARLALYLSETNTRAKHTSSHRTGEAACQHPGSKHMVAVQHCSCSVRL